MLSITVETRMRHVCDFVQVLGTCLTLDQAEAALKRRLAYLTKPAAGTSAFHQSLLVYRGGSHVALTVDGANRLVLITEAPDTLANLKAIVSTVRKAAEEQARLDVGQAGVYRSRGVVVTVDTAGDAVLNRSDCWEWSGNLRDLRAAWARYAGTTDAAGNLPSAMTLCGGFDYAESPRDMNDCCYDPWVSEWDVAVPPALFNPTKKEA